MGHEGGKKGRDSNGSEGWGRMESNTREGSGGEVEERKERRRRRSSDKVMEDGMPSMLQQSTWVGLVEGRKRRDDVERTERGAGGGMGDHDACDRRAM